VQTDAQGALIALRDERVLFAGFHGSASPSYLDDVRIARLHLGTREVGLAAFEAADCASLGALAGKRLATRPPTAGIRAHLDAALTAARLSLPKLRVRATPYATHVEAIAAVVRGEADVALASAGWARRFGLAFTPLVKEPYDLLLRAAHLGHPAAVALCESAQDPAFRAAVVAAGASDGPALGTGAIRYSADE
jgi:molybdate-binding protein